MVLSALTKKQNRRKIFRIILAVLLILAAARLALPYLGEALVAEDKPEPADLIVVLMGGGLNRVFAAVDLYNDGMSRKILMVNSYQPGYEEAFSRGISVPRETDIAKAAAVQMGVRAEDIIILPGAAKSTRDEALIVKQYLQNRPAIDTLIIATSPSHSARAKKIFKWALAGMSRDVRIISCPSRYDSFDPAHWWQDMEDVEQVILEYMKFISFKISK